MFKENSWRFKANQYSKKTKSMLIKKKIKQ